jgi:hypothetical protein
MFGKRAYSDPPERFGRRFAGENICAFWGNQYCFRSSTDVKNGFGKGE